MKESEKRLKDDILKRILQLENKLGRIKTQPVKLSEESGSTIINYTLKLLNVIYENL
jgi:hypothetical protein